MSRFSSPRAAVLLALLAAGCGAGRGDLGGAVTYQGKPVSSGTVTAVGSDGVPKSGFIADGKYEVRDLPAGQVKLAVTSPDPGRAPPKSRKGESGPAPKPERAGWVPLPEKFADLATSGLTADLKAGANSHDIELK